MVNWRLFFHMLNKKKWLVVVITVVCLLLAVYMALFKLNSKYEAATKLIVMVQADKGTNQISYNELLASLALVNVYKEMITSQTVTSEVIRRLDLKEMTDKDLTDIIDVEVVPNSSVINITVKYNDPSLVFKITNEVTNVFIQKVSELLHQNNISIVSNAVVPEKPVFPNRLNIMEFGLLAGIILSLSIVLVFVYLEEN